MRKLNKMLEKTILNENFFKITKFQYFFFLSFKINKIAYEINQITLQL